jgi:hypothetical protein
MQYLMYRKCRCAAAAAAATAGHACYAPCILYPLVRLVMNTCTDCHVCACSTTSLWECMARLVAVSKVCVQVVVAVLDDVAAAVVQSMHTVSTAATASGQA